MKRYENDCVGCATESYPCVGSTCKYRNNPHWYCDNCGEEHEPTNLYLYDGNELCSECVLKNFKKVSNDTEREDEW